MTKPRGRPREKMTPARSRLLEAVYRYNVRGEPVTIRLLAKELGVSVARVGQLAARLRQDGYLEAPPPLARASMVVTAVPVFTGDPAVVGGWVKVG